MEKNKNAYFEDALKNARVLEQFARTKKLESMIDLVFESLPGDPDYINPGYAVEKSEHVSSLLGTKITPYEFAAYWNRKVSEWADKQLSGMTPIATVACYDETIHERITIAWDDFGDLKLHTAWHPIIFDGEDTFSNPVDEINFSRMRKLLSYIYKDPSFKLRFDALAFGSHEDIERLAANFFERGLGSDHESMKAIIESCNLDWRAACIIRRELCKLEENAVG